jgi:hypothetical protein
MVASQMLKIIAGKSRSYHGNAKKFPYIYICMLMALGSSKSEDNMRCSVLFVGPCINNIQAKKGPYNQASVSRPLGQATLRQDTCRPLLTGGI